MTNPFENPPPNPGDPNHPSVPPTQQVQYNPLSARLPEKVARGVFSTGALVFSSPQEFVIDFIQGLARPAQITARVVLTPVVMGQFLGALRDNFAKFQTSFGAPQALPKPPQQERQPSAREIYDDLKISEDIQSGAYANSVMIGHSPTEFHLDFITTFFPNASLSARVYVSASRVPQLIDTIAQAMQNAQRPAGSLPPGQTMPPPPPNPV
jgi:hypothetical protein